LAESPVVERGVLTAPGPVWDAAVRRAEVIGQLAARSTVGLVAADEAATELGVSRRQVYVLFERWRAGEGVWRRTCCRGAPAAAVVAVDCRTRSR
jgi:putative transposase